MSWIGQVKVSPLSRPPISLQPVVMGPSFSPSLPAPTALQHGDGSRRSRLRLRRPRAPPEPLPALRLLPGVPGAAGHASGQRPGPGQWRQQQRQQQQPGVIQQPAGQPTRQPHPPWGATGWQRGGIHSRHHLRFHYRRHITRLTAGTLSLPPSPTGHPTPSKQTQTQLKQRRLKEVRSFFKKKKQKGMMLCTENKIYFQFYFCI